ncbi:hypothetical protein B0H17DRAFT_1143839 [Mycena rosella]|uniref:Uncharacterized protein n=1 Tax=Mycena rosella TaxID=1033263 RepID=A0AAD7G7E0_MYCRO|nr:hypothetical protein B0H17DRAFT_1143839 [Mycena rosella]
MGNRVYRFGPLLTAFCDCDAVRVLAIAASVLAESTDDDSAYTVEKCFLILGRITATEIGHEWIPIALENGFLRALVSSALIPGVFHGILGGHLKFFFTLVLLPSLVYYEVVSEIEGALRATEDVASTRAFQGSNIYETWQEFTSVAQQRPTVLRIVTRSSRLVGRRLVSAQGFFVRVVEWSSQRNKW